MDFKKFSRDEYEKIAGDEKAQAEFLAGLEKAVAGEWNTGVEALVSSIAQRLNQQGHNLARLEDHILAFGDLRPEGQPSLVLDIFATCGVTAKAEKPEVREVPPEEKWFLENSDKVFAKFLEHGYAALAPRERMFHDVDQLDREVNNGGFAQYFTNSAGQNAHEALEALKFIGAKKVAKLLDEAIDLFDEGRVPKDDEARNQAVERIETTHAKKLGRLDNRYYKSAENLLGLLYQRLGPGREGE